MYSLSEVVQFVHDSNMFGSSGEEKVPKKRVARRVIAAPRVARKVTSSRAVATKRVEEETNEREEQPTEQREEPQEASTEKRKAPTPLSAEEVRRVQKRKQRITVLVLLGLGLGSSAAVGFLDTGQIDAEKIIEARNERIRNNQANTEDMQSSTIEIPVQDTGTQGKVDGGLIGGAPSSQPSDPVVSASSTATSTDQTASSTEAVASSTDDGTVVSEVGEVTEPETEVTE